MASLLLVAVCCLVAGGSPAAADTGTAVSITGPAAGSTFVAGSTIGVSYVCTGSCAGGNLVLRVNGQGVAATSHPETPGTLLWDPLWSGGRPAAGVYWLTLELVDADGDTHGDTRSINLITEPGPVASLSTVGSSGQFTATWTPPADSGGSAVDSYRVTWDLGSSLPGGPTEQSATVPGQQTTFTATGLTNGQSYQVVVQSHNAAGWSTETRRNVLVAAVPDAPAAVFLQFIDGQLLVSWLWPPSNGGAPVSGYIVTVDGVEYQAGMYDAFTTVAGLSPGPPVTVSVAAVNEIGRGAATARSTSEALGAPRPPRRCRRA